MSLAGGRGLPANLTDWLSLGRAIVLAPDAVAHPVQLGLETGDGNMGRKTRLKHLFSNLQQHEAMVRISREVLRLETRLGW